MTSHTMSHGHLAPLVGRRFVVVGLRVYFAGIQSLFAFILLTQDHDFVLYWCGVRWALRGRLVLFCYCQGRPKQVHETNTI